MFARSRYKMCFSFFGIKLANFANDSGINRNESMNLKFSFLSQMNYGTLSSTVFVDEIYSSEFNRTIVNSLLIFTANCWMNMCASSELFVRICSTFKSNTNKHRALTFIVELVEPNRNKHRTDTLN